MTDQKESKKNSMIILSKFDGDVGHITCYDVDTNTKIEEEILNIDKNEFASFINKNSYWRLGRFDWFCGGLSLGALVFWQLADSPLVAVLLATTANTLAYVPTFMKAWNYPETESRLIFITSFLSAILIIPAIPVWTIANSAFQIGLMATTGAMLVAIYRKDFGIGQTI